MVTLVQGSVEYLMVDVSDRAGELTTMVGTSPVYNVYRRADATQVITNLSATVVGGDPMTLRCLIDTSNGPTWTSEEYELYVKFTLGSETPEHGPFRFYVEKKNTPG
jgi:hypothetical protein